MNNRYLKPKEAVCSVCGDKIKVGEKYALGTVKAYKYKDSDTNNSGCVTYDEIFCGFCKPTRFEYEGVHSEDGVIRVPYVTRKGKQYYSMERVRCYIEKYLNFYRNEKEEEA